jgi:hypothetical protein
MSAMTAGIILSTVALLVQGTRCLVRQGAPPFVRRFGALTLLLAGLSAVLFVLIHFGESVLSPEFDAVMARGHRRGLAALVFGLALAASLGLHVQRLKAERPGRLAALLFLGVVVGLLATMRITTSGARTPNTLFSPSMASVAADANSVKASRPRTMAAISVSGTTAQLHFVNAAPIAAQLCETAREITRAMGQAEG